MNRRQLLQSMAILGGATMLSPKHVFATRSTKPLHFVGIGDGGCKILQYLISKGCIISSDYTAINSDFKGYSLPVERQIVIEVPANTYTGRNVNLNFLNDISSQLPPTITNVFIDKDKYYVLLAGLGGFTGSYLCKAIPGFLRANSLSNNSIISLPFSHEGLVKRKQAMVIKHSLRDQPNTVFVDYDGIRAKHGNFKLKDAFNIADEYSFQAFQQLNTNI